MPATESSNLAWSDGVNNMAGATLSIAPSARNWNAGGKSRSDDRQLALSPASAIDNAAGRPATNAPQAIRSAHAPPRTNPNTSEPSSRTPAKSWPRTPRSRQIDRVDRRALHGDDRP